MSATHEIKLNTLTLFTLNSSNWLIWRRAVHAGMKRIGALGILNGTEKKPNTTAEPVSKSKTEADVNSTKILQTQLNEARNQYKQALAALKAAADAVETDTNDVGKRTALVEAEAEAEAAEDAYNRIRQQRSSIKSAQVDTDPPATRSEVEDWERRHTWPTISWSCHSQSNIKA